MLKASAKGLLLSAVFKREVTQRLSSRTISKPTSNDLKDIAPNANGLAIPKKAPYIQHVTFTDDASSIGTL